MIKIFVDSCSSIKQEEKEKYGVEIFPLKFKLGEKEYSDGIDLTIDEFYKKLIEEKLFPKTSLPSLVDVEERVKAALDQGYDVLIISFSSGLSGTYSAMRSLFADEKRVRVVDSKTAVGGIRILVEEALKHLDKSLDEVEKILLELIPRVKIVAVPETLDYLHRGGRLSSSAWVVGSLIQLKPLISLDSKKDGKVIVIGKALGKRRAIQSLAKYLDEFECDTSYPIVPEYTYNKDNLDLLLAATDGKYKAVMTDYDNLDPVVACHWGPGAFGYAFVAKK